MWRAVGTYVQGTSHIKFDIPCQDYCSYERVVIGSTPALVVAIADGAGSAPLSQVGSREAVEHLLRVIPGSLSSILEASEKLARHWLHDTREHLDELAAQEGCDLRDLGCTILVAILGEFASFFAQIGDGAWIIERDGEYLAATWPSGGEYVNETTFLTSSNWAESIKCEFIAGRISAAAGFTDGLQRLALRFDSQSVYAPFFDPLFTVLRDTDDETTLISPLIQFLSSDRVADRTDDDKTLVLACRNDTLLLNDGN